MENSKIFLKEHDILPSISFKDGTEHTITLLKDKQLTFKDKNGEDKDGVKYMVKENGEPKQFMTASQTLISKLAETEEGTEVKIKMVNSRTADGKFNSHYEVEKIGEEKVEIKNPKKEEIPVLEDEEDIGDPPF